MEPADEKNEELRNWLEPLLFAIIWESNLVAVTGTFQP
jgi:hypothetical protein